MSNLHPFAQTIRTLGRGKKGTKDLTEEEAYTAFSLVLKEEVEPEQLGAFLMLLRVKEETPGELAGFVRAAREYLILPANAPAIQLDWSSYAGKRRHLPWYVLSALLLAENGIYILMHGIKGIKDNRAYTRDALAALGLTPANSLTQATAQIQANHFAFIELQNLHPKLAKLISLRQLLGLRSPVHSLCRLLNPFSAPHMIQGIFHPGYQVRHQEAALLLQQPHLCVIKGDGGEAERNPDNDCEVLSIRNNKACSEVWPALYAQRHLKDKTMDCTRLRTAWQGKEEDEYGRAAIISTAALVLKLLGQAETQNSALEQAQTLWAERPKDKF
ncbi:Anthranilate phosphoribosyltransferase like [hydrothermal vent metagenome]|uniref:Anthranilate phosphoribosyltransferase like n=1 Tax=hydrothermal vent metagenome TaxID=652676 RepID=A0A3B0Z7K2_9ZZZZ